MCRRFPNLILLVVSKIRNLVGRPNEDCLGFMGTIGFDPCLSSCSCFTLLALIGVTYFCGLVVSNYIEIRRMLFLNLCFCVLYVFSLRTSCSLILFNKLILLSKRQKMYLHKPSFPKANLQNLLSKD